MLSRVPFLLLLATPGAAQNTARMDQIVQSYVSARQFMGSVLVARGDELIHSKGYGSANLEWNVPNAPDTKFRLGSVTKQFTAASILLLEERGKLNTADAVKKYLPDAPAAWDKITLFHLLTHTSGIPNFTSFPDYQKTEAFATTPEQLVARFRDKPLDFAPGEKWSYSNSGYVLLSYLVEKVSGQNYEQFVRENIFAPLAMNNSGYDSNTAVISHRAAGYVTGPRGFENAGYIHMSIPQGAGALYSTTEDLWKWEKGLFGGKVLKAESLAKMTKPFKDGYAMGLAVALDGGRKVIEHGGGIEGFNTELAYYPEDRLTVVVLGNVNGGAPGDIARKVAAVAHGETVKLPGEHKEITLDPAVAERYVGAYAGPEGMYMLITRKEGKFYAKLGNQQPGEIFPESETMFFAKAVDAQFEFGKTSLTLHQGGRDLVLQRAPDAEAKRLMEAADATAKRIQSQTPAPGSLQALRRLIEGLASGKPDYESMSPRLAELTRQQLGALQEKVSGMGALQDLKFKSVGPAGPDIYEAKFEKGSLECRIWMAGEKIENANMR